MPLKIWKLSKFSLLRPTFQAKAMSNIMLWNRPLRAWRTLTRLKATSTGCLENEDLRPKTQKQRPLENEDLENEDPPENEGLENEDPLENEDLENEDPLENEDLENEDPQENKEPLKK